METMGVFMLEKLFKYSFDLELELSSGINSIQ